MISPMSKFYDVRGLDNLIYKSLCMKLISIVQMPWNKVSSERKSQQIDNKNPIITVALGLEIIVNAHIQILNELNADYTPRNEVNFQQTNHPSNQQRTSYQNESPCLFFFYKLTLCPSCQPPHMSPMVCTSGGQKRIGKWRVEGGRQRAAEYVRSLIVGCRSVCR